MTTAPEAPARPAASSPAQPSTVAENEIHPAPSRRQVLLAAGVGAGALTLAACGSSTTASTPAATSSAAASSTSAAAPSSSEAAPSSSAAAPSSSEAAPSSSAAAPSSSAAGGAGGAALAELSAVPVGGAVSAKDAAGKPIIIAQPTAGKAVAFSAICTHKGCPVAPKGAELHCPCHGSNYNALTGAVINGPAASPLAPVAVSVKDGKVIAA